jgi:hypothetical protein
MKKITLFAALLVAGMATAQVQLAPEQMEIRKLTSTASAKAVKEASAEVFTAESYAKYSQAAEYADVDYYYVEGMMHGGITPQAYGSIPAIMLPGLETVTFKNALGATSWYTSAPSNELLAENSDTLEFAFGRDYLVDFMGYSPYTTDHTLEQDGQTSSIKGYRYAASEEMSVVTYGYTPWTISTGENIPMTLCGMYCDPIYGSEGNDCYMVGNKDATLGKYLYGTNRLVDGVRADTIGQFVRNISTMKINQVYINVYNSDYNGAVMFPEGTEIKVELFNADLSTGNIDIDWSEPVATTVLSEEDYVSWGEGYEWIGNLIVKFYEVDIFGSTMETPVWVDGDFYLQITGFNESGCDFGIRSDFYNINTGSTVYTVNGAMTYGASQGGCNLNIGYDAYWPSVIVAKESEVLVAPAEGGVVMDGEYNAFAFYTNVADLELWVIDEEESAEWLEIGMDDSTLESEGYILAQLTAAALPEGETGRKGALVLDVDGYKVSIPVVQGELVETGVENVVTPSFNGKTFNLLGVEVDENYKGIVIKNGQKFIQ